MVWHAYCSQLRKPWGMCRNLGDDIWQRMCGGDVMMWCGVVSWEAGMGKEKMTMSEENRGKKEGEGVGR